MKINFYPNDRRAGTTIMLYLREGVAGLNTVKISTKIIIDPSEWDRTLKRHKDEKINSALEAFRSRATEIFHLIKGSGDFNRKKIKDALKKYLFNDDQINLINIMGAIKRGCRETTIYIVNEPQTENYKIGCCVEFKKRLTILNSGRSRALIPVAIFNIPYGLFHTPRNIENYFMHDRLKDKRIKKHERDYKSEWFKLSIDDLCEVIQIIEVFFRGKLSDEIDYWNFRNDKLWDKIKRDRAA